MYITARTITFSVLASLLLFACGSSPQVRYFSLSPVATKAGSDPENSVVLGLGPLRIPEYLNRSQIVTRGIGAELQIDEFSRWAEPLDPSIHRALSVDVDRLLDGVVVVAFPYEAMIRSHVDYRLVGEILRFDSDAAGRIVLETQWVISSVDAEVIVHGQRSRYEARASSAGDPGAIAEAMNQALAKFSRDIAGKLEAGLQE